MPTSKKTRTPKPEPVVVEPAPPAAGVDRAALVDLVRRLRLAIDATVADPSQISQFTELANELEALGQ